MLFGYDSDSRISGTKYETGITKVKFVYKGYKTIRETNETICSLGSTDVYEILVPSTRNFRTITLFTIYLSTQLALVDFYPGVSREIL